MYNNLKAVLFHVSASGEETADDANSLTYAIVVTKQRKNKGLLDYIFFFYLTRCEEHNKTVMDKIYLNYWYVL